MSCITLCACRCGQGGLEFRLVLMELTKRRGWLTHGKRYWLKQNIRTSTGCMDSEEILADNGHKNLQSDSCNGFLWGSTLFWLQEHFPISQDRTTEYSKKYHMGNCRDMSSEVSV